jgi:hypothetical protein
VQYNREHQLSRKGIPTWQKRGEQRLLLTAENTDEIKIKL